MLLQVPKNKNWASTCAKDRWTSASADTCSIPCWSLGLSAGLKIGSFSLFAKTRDSRDLRKKHASIGEAYAAYPPINDQDVNWLKQIFVDFLCYLFDWIKIRKKSQTMSVLPFYPTCFFCYLLILAPEKILHLWIPTGSNSLVSTSNLLVIWGFVDFFEANIPTWNLKIDVGGHSLEINQKRWLTTQPKILKPQESIVNQLLVFQFLPFKNWVTLLVGGFKPSEKYESKWESSPAQVEVKIKNVWNYHLVFLSLIQMIPFQKKKIVPGLGFSTCRLGIGTFIPKAIRTTRICRAARRRQGRWGTGLAKHLESSKGPGKSW